MIRHTFKLKSYEKGLLDNIQEFSISRSNGIAINLNLLLNTALKETCPKKGMTVDFSISCLLLCPQLIFTNLFNKIFDFAQDQIISDEGVLDLDKQHLYNQVITGLTSRLKLKFPTEVEIICDKDLN